MNTMDTDSRPDRGELQGALRDAVDAVRAAPPPADAFALRQRHSRLRRCNKLTGHRFICAECGAKAGAASRFRYYGASAALALSTAVAAVLLAMLVARWGPSDVPAGRSSVPATGQGDNTFPTEITSLSPSSMGDSGQPRSCDDDAPAYACLRAQVLRYGVEWLDRRPSTAGKPMGSPDKLPSNREFCERLFEEQRGS